jgi:hypothetical protein
MKMRYFEIRAPRADFTGRIGGLSFADGVARVQFDDERDKNGLAVSEELAVNPGRSLVLFAQRRPGYRVIELDERGKPLDAKSDDEESPSAQPPARSASKAEWVDYVVEHHDVPRAEAEGTTKEDLVATYGAKGDVQ